MKKRQFIVSGDKFIEVRVKKSPNGNYVGLATFWHDNRTVKFISPDISKAVQGSVNGLLKYSENRD